MVRNPIKKKQDKTEEAPTPTPEAAAPGEMQYIERPVNIALLNDKLNYITGLLHKIAKACEVELN